MNKRKTSAIVCALLLAAVTLWGVKSVMLTPPELRLGDTPERAAALFGEPFYRVNNNGSELEDWRLPDGSTRTALFFDGRAANVQDITPDGTMTRNDHDDALAARYQSELQAQVK